MKKVGFIGTGVMGVSIVRHLLKKGYSVTVYNRTKSKAEPLIEEGARWAESPLELTNQSDIVFTMVGYPKDVEEVYYSEQGIFNGNVEGKVLIDLTTSTPSLAMKISETAKEKGAATLDAPVSGGDLGAEKGTLTIMVGGEEETFNQVKDILEVFSASMTLHGPSGSGQHTKAANQIMVAGTMTGITELMIYAKRAGLDLEKVSETVNGGAGRNWSLENYAPRIINDDYSPGFFVKHFIKDLGIALDEAERMGIDLPATRRAKELYDQLKDAGYGNDGTQSLVKLWWNK
ncbi:NAD(P)-dependent oxidoreductase [Alkalibacterium sp. MB6]|uniref:NAD(P)-dependent oxidoreductase n=1 Tax=Alkalibacterium sp. MB6 TaxID=2081965 RepID=UPI001379C63C